MIQELYCKNFKIFREATTFPLRRLTVVTGPNNSGKSTIFDLIRLINAEERDGDGNSRLLYSLNLNAGNRLRTFQELLANQDEALEVGIQGFAPVEIGSLSYTDKSTELEVHHDFQLNDNTRIRSRFEAVGENYFLSEREVALCPPGASEAQRVFHELNDLHTSPKSKGTIESKQEDENTKSESSNNSESWHPESIPSAESISPVFTKIRFGLDQGEGMIRDNRDRSDDRDRILTPHMETTSASLREALDYELQREITWTVYEAMMKVAFGVLNRYSQLSEQEEYSVSTTDIDLLTQQPSSIEHSPPLLISGDNQGEFPKRSLFTFFGANSAESLKDRSKCPDWVPPDKKDLWYAALEEVVGPLIEKIDEGISTEVLYVPALRGTPKRHYGPGDALFPLLRRFQELGDSKVERIEEWLHTFEIGSHLRVETVGPNLYEAYVERDGEIRYLADLGSGSAQLIPLFINLVTRQSSLVLIEEPEANLHPNLQARLADFFVELIDRGIQVMVETHSEYLTRRLQYLVARGDCDPNHANVLYLRDDESSEHSDRTPKVQEITIDEDGQLSQPFGPGFFDQSTNLMVDLFKYGSDN